MRDPCRIITFCEQLANIWERVPDWRFGQLVSNVFGQIQADDKDVFFIEDDEMMSEIRDYFDIDDDMTPCCDGIIDLECRLMTLEESIDTLDDEITGIKAKMTIAKTKQNKPMSKECRAWFNRAGVALSIKNNQLRKLHIEKMRVERELKEAKANRQKRRERVQNELFYAKLKELMNEDELKTFLAECQSKLNWR